MNVLGCLRKANDKPGPYPMTTSASIWHNKFNMNVNEAQIKIQHWMEKIKGGGSLQWGGKKDVKMLLPLRRETGWSSRTLDAARFFSERLFSA